MPGISQDFKKGLIKDAYDYAFEKYDAIEEIWPRYMEEQTITGDFWQSTSVVNSGTWRKTGESEPFMAQKIVEGFTVYARIFDYTQATTFTDNIVSDHQKIKNLVRETAAGWGATAKDTREEFYARPFNKGGLTAGDWVFNGTPESQAISDASGDGAYDGTTAAIMPWFNLTGNARASKGGATYFNGHALAISPDNLKTIITHMVGTNNRMENDTRMRLDPNCIVYPTNLDMTVREILNSTLVPYGATNTTNVLNGILEPIKNPYFDDTDAFFVGHKKKGIIALTRQEPVFNFFQDEKNRCYWATAVMRIGFMMNNWRYWTASQFSTS